MPCFKVHCPSLKEVASQSLSWPHKQGFENLLTPMHAGQDLDPVLDFKVEDIIMGDGVVA